MSALWRRRNGYLTAVGGLAILASKSLATGLLVWVSKPGIGGQVASLESLCCGKVKS